MKISPHFDLSEFACHDGTPVPDEFVPNVEFLANEVLEVVRAAYGTPLAVISGFRTRRYNTAVGGAENSNHLDATAADIRTDGDTVALYHTILTLYENGRLPALGGLGYYPGWIHVDTHRSIDGHLRLWGGTRVGHEQDGGVR